MPTLDHDHAVVARVTTYLGRLLDRLGERVGDRVAERLEATLDVVTDRELMRDLDRADSEPDEDAISLDEIRSTRSA